MRKMLHLTGHCLLVCAMVVLLASCVQSSGQRSAVDAEADYFAKVLANPDYREQCVVEHYAFDLPSMWFDFPPYVSSPYIKNMYVNKSRTRRGNGRTGFHPYITVSLYPESAAAKIFSGKDGYERFVSQHRDQYEKLELAYAEDGRKIRSAFTYWNGKFSAKLVTIITYIRSANGVVEVLYEDVDINEEYMAEINRMMDTIAMQ